MKGGMGNIMKQAQQMQGNMEKAQKELAETEVVGESGAGLVKITMNGRHDVKRVVIDPEYMSDDKEMVMNSYMRGYNQEMINTAIANTL